MKFTCSATTLTEALQIVTKALPGRTTNMILEGILVQTDMNEVILTCSDERITIVTRMEAYVTEPGRGVVPGKLFNEIVRRLSDGDIDISMNDRFMFTIRGAGNRTNISGQDPDLYPALPVISGEKEISLPQDMLKDMIQKTEFAIAVEDVREVLTGCLLEIEGGDVTMVALDGFRLALKRAKCGDVLEKLSAIIPGRAVGDIGKLLSDDPIAREGNNNLLVLKIADGEMAIEAHSQIGDVYEKLDIQQEGANLNIAFNVKYLTDVVRFIDAEQIELNMNNAVSPCVITPVGDEDYLHLVLPVRTGATN